MRKDGTFSPVFKDREADRQMDRQTDIERLRVGACCVRRVGACCARRAVPGVNGLSLGSICGCYPGVYVHLSGR